MPKSLSQISHEVVVCLHLKRGTTTVSLITESNSVWWRDLSTECLLFVGCHTFHRIIVLLADTNKITFYSFIETSVSEIEETFLQFTNRNDIAILLINQNVCFKNALVSWLSHNRCDGFIPDLTLQTSLLCLFRKLESAPSDSWNKQCFVFPKFWKLQTVNWLKRDQSRHCASSRCSTRVHFPKKKKDFDVRCTSSE